MKQIIKAPVDSIYCSDFMTEIPKGIIDKKETGCGLTSLALEDNNPTIVAVPTIEVIKNKVAQYPNNRRNDTVFGYYANKSISELKQYIHNTLVPKIIVTYDSFYKLVDLVDTSTFRVVVDEFSDLLDAYSYRDKAIDSLLNSVSKFDYVSYISATPIKPEYYPKQLIGLDEYEIDWGNYIQITVDRTKTNKPYQKVCNIIEHYRMAGDKGIEVIKNLFSHSAYFFVNSVNSIINIIKSANLTPEEVRVICSNNKANQSKLGKFTIQTALDPEKKFNFITSTAFKGCDFYSETGLIHIVSNTINSNTLISIDTDIKQIAGRIRNSNNPFNRLIIHIYNTNNSLLGEEEFTELINKKIENTNNLIAGFYSMNEVHRESYRIKFKYDEKYNKNNNDYISITDKGDLVFNEFKVLNDKRHYEVTNHLYKNGVNIRKAFIESGYKFKDNQIFELLSETDYLIKATNGSFKEYCLEYINNIDSREYIASRYPLIKDAYEMLGKDKMKSLSYNSNKFIEELKFNDNSFKILVKQELTNSVVVGSIYTTSDIKELINKTYEKLHLNKKGKSTDIEEYFVIKRKSKRVDNKPIKVLEIVSIK